MCKCKHKSGFLSGESSFPIEQIQPQEDEFTGTSSGSSSGNTTTESGFLEPVAYGNPEEVFQTDSTPTQQSTTELTALQLLKMAQEKNRYTYSAIPEAPKKITSWVILLSSGLSALFLLKKMKVI
jgi:hypothetical protein